MNRQILVLLFLVSIGGRAFAAGVTPADNPVAAYYGPERGYPAWTEKIRWDNVIDMSRYTKGKTNFEKFENARDKLAADGGGVLYYPAGTYDFSEGPFDGPNGRGLMLRSGVIIRGEAPADRPRAVDGDLDLPTRFVFGTREVGDAIDTGERISLKLHDAIVLPSRKRAKAKPGKAKRGRIRRASLWINLAAPGGSVTNGRGNAYSSALSVQGHVVEARVSGEGDEIVIVIDAQLRWPERDEPAKGRYTLRVRRISDSGIEGTYQSTLDGNEHGGKVTGGFGSIAAVVPRDWNLVGLLPEKTGLKDVSNVGLCWVHLDGATVCFGPDMVWGKTWWTAGCWRSKYAKEAWKDRVPDGTHPFDPFMGAPMGESGGYAGAGAGRVVFGCSLVNGCVLNDYDTCGRGKFSDGYGEDGYHMDRYSARIIAYGSRVFIANNRLMRTRGRNFRHPQKTVRTSGFGAVGYRFIDTRDSVVLFDYNKTTAIDVNKALLGLLNRKLRVDTTRSRGYWEEGIIVKDNYVYNHGGLGYSISGKWCVIADNVSGRNFLRENRDLYGGAGGWELTLDGFRESSPGGGGEVMDNMSRAFEICGMNLWVARNRMSNMGSFPGGDSEGIWWQPFAGTHFVSSAVTHNDWVKGEGSGGPAAAYDANVMGGLFAWNKVPGKIGLLVRRNKEFSDLAIVANQAGSTGVVDVAVASNPASALDPPTGVRAEAYADDAVKVSWEDVFDGEIGYRVDRSIAGGKWTAIAYRPPQKEKHELNEPAWIDFLAPPGRPLRYRVATLNSKDDDSGASKVTAPLILTKPKAGKARQ